MPIIFIPIIYLVTLISFSLNCSADLIDNVDTGACKIVDTLTFK